LGGKERSKQTEDRRKMEDICEHIKMMRKPYANEDMSFHTMDTYNPSISNLRKILNKKIGKSIRNVKIFRENWLCQRKTVISFRYKNLQCEIGHHFDTQVDYLFVRMVQIQPVMI
jgi:hypothetical protein